MQACSSGWLSLMVNNRQSSNARPQSVVRSRASTGQSKGRSVWIQNAMSRDQLPRCVYDVFVIRLAAQSSIQREQLLSKEAGTRKHEVTEYDSGYRRRRREVIWCDDVVLAMIEIGLRSVVEFSAILWRCSTTVWSISLSEIEQASNPTLCYPLA